MIGTKRAVDLREDLITKPEQYFIKRGEAMALSLFHEMAKRVPAYQDFLKNNNVNPRAIQSIADFSKIPAVSKDNYLRKYPRESLFWDGKLSSKAWVVSTTSGSTGQPFYFFRSAEQDDQYALTAELYLLNNFQIHKYKTLYIDGFAMGAWIGGLFTYQAIRSVAIAGHYPLTIITPGVVRQEIINAIINIGQDFEQVIIGGYPPFIKDIVDEGIRLGINWDKYRIGFVFSAEGFTERFREYIARKCSLKNPLFQTLNHYGTVDLGTMAHETPLSILVRKLTVNNECLWKNIFGGAQIEPTLAQYNPEHFFFEEVNNSLFCSARSGIPLVRYDLKDGGGIISLREMMRIMKANQIELVSEIKKAGVSSRIWNLPFVYVHERKDFVVKLYGANIYPVSFRNVLEKESYSQLTTGRFTLEVTYDKNMIQRLTVHVELKRNKYRSKKFAELLADAFEQGLLANNSEYRSNYREAPEKQPPLVRLWHFEDSLHFHRKGKQAWVKKGTS
jgi:phenylacetate-CoA ligase